MSDKIATFVGVAAAGLSMTSFAPQLIKIVKERDAQSVSTRMYLLTVAGFLAWIVYGVMIDSWPVAGSNGVNLALSSAILLLKLRLDQRDRLDGAGPRTAG